MCVSVTTCSHITNEFDFFLRRDTLCKMKHYTRLSWHFSMLSIVFIFSLMCMLIIYNNDNGSYTCVFELFDICIYICSFYISSRVDHLRENKYLIIIQFNQFFVHIPLKLLILTGEGGNVRKAFGLLSSRPFLCLCEWVVFCQLIVDLCMCLSLCLCVCEWPWSVFVQFHDCMSCLSE